MAKRMMRVEPGHYIATHQGQEYKVVQENERDGGRHIKVWKTYKVSGAESQEIGSSQSYGLAKAIIFGNPGTPTGAPVIPETSPYV